MHAIYLVSLNAYGFEFDESTKTWLRLLYGVYST